MYLQLVLIRQFALYLAYGTWYAFRTQSGTVVCSILKVEFSADYEVSNLCSISQSTFSFIACSVYMQYVCTYSMYVHVCKWLYTSMGNSL